MKRFALLLSLAFFLSVPWHFSQARAVSVSPLVKASGPGVYYLQGTSVSIFPTEEVFFSWYPDFSEVREITDVAFSRYQLKGRVLYRPGLLVKTPSSPVVYAVEPWGVLRPIVSETIARDVYGLEWSKHIFPLPDDLFSSYKVGSVLDRALYPEGTFGKSTDDVWYLVVDGVLRSLSDDQAAAYGFDRLPVLLIDPLRNVKGKALGKLERPYADPIQPEATRQKEALTMTRKSVPRLLEGGAPRAPFLQVEFSVSQPISVKTVVLDVRAYTDGDADSDPGGLVQRTRAEAVRGNLARFTILDENSAPLFPLTDLSMDTSLDARQTVTLTGQALLAPGRHLWSVVADVDYDIPPEQVYQVSWLLDRSVFVTGSRPLVINKPKALSSDKITAHGGLLTLRPDKGRSVVLVRGSDTYETLNGFVFSNPREEPVSLISLTLTGFIDEMGGDSDFVQGQDADDGTPTTVVAVVPTVSLVQTDDTGVGATAAVSLDGRAVFSHLPSFVIPAKGSLSLLVQVSAMESLATDGSQRVAFDLVEPTDVVARMEDGRSVEVKNASPNGAQNPKRTLTVVGHGSASVRASGIQGVQAHVGEQGVDFYSVTFTAGKEENLTVQSVGLALSESGSVRSIKEARLRFSDEPSSSGVRGAFDSGNLFFSNLGFSVPAGTSISLILTVDFRTALEGATVGDVFAWTLLPERIGIEGATSRHVFIGGEEGRDIGLRASTSRAVPLRE